MTDGSTLDLPLQLLLIKGRETGRSDTVKLGRTAGRISIPNNPGAELSLRVQS